MVQLIELQSRNLVVVGLSPTKTVHLTDTSRADVYSLFVQSFSKSLLQAAGESWFCEGEESPEQSFLSNGDPDKEV